MQIRLEQCFCSEGKLAIAGAALFMQKLVVTDSVGTFVFGT